MAFKYTTIALVALLQGALAISFDTPDSQGYFLPSSGSASTTQFLIGTEFGGGTACGVNGMPNGQGTSGGQGNGPGYLYVVFPSQFRCGFLEVVTDARTGSNKSTRLWSQSQWYV